MDRVKWMLVILAACVLVTAGAVIYAVAQPQGDETLWKYEVRAEKFILVDSQDKACASLMIAGDSLPELSLRAKDGLPHVSVTFGAKGNPELSLWDNYGKRRAELALTPDGSPMLSLLDKNWKPRAVLALDADENPKLELYDKDGKVIWQAP